MRSTTPAALSLAPRTRASRRSLRSGRPWMVVAPPSSSPTPTRVCSQSSGSIRTRLRAREADLVSSSRCSGIRVRWPSARPASTSIVTCRLGRRSGRSSSRSWRSPSSWGSRWWFTLARRTTTRWTSCAASAAQSSCTASHPQGSCPSRSSDNYVSFAGNVTYPNALELRLAAAQVPADRLLAETDCPYLAPQPVRGRPNEPANVMHTLAGLAAARGDDPAELERQIESNAEVAFQLP